MTQEQLTAVQQKVKHVIVLMLENRSFDHMLGASGITGTIAGTGVQGMIDGIDLKNPPYNLNTAGQRIYFSDDAPFILEQTDPGHEFHDVMVQLTGNPTPDYDRQTGVYPQNLNNGGFVINFEHQKKAPPDPTVVMRGFSPARLPVLNQLAREFVVCDRWFSSLPGPTWPNRFFVHAATSGGLDHSPSLEEIAGADTFFGYHFDKGTIFRCLSEQRLNWAIYAGNHFPQSLALRGVRSNDVYEFEDFKKDIQQPGFPAYTFIEPDYGHFLMGNYRFGNSQHPLDDVTGGERLTKEVYETVRASPIWKETLLIITYDEHGGFFDHVIPPTTVAPGDTKPYQKNNFNFQQLGVRVPAVIISPLIEKNLIDKRVYDHSSILATLEKLFDMGSLTDRDASANHFLDLITLDAPRDTPLTLVSAADSHLPTVPPTSEQEIQAAPDEGVDSTLVGFVHVAKLRQMEVATPDHRKTLRSSVPIGDSRSEALEYMKNVKEKTETVPGRSLLGRIENFFKRIFK